MSESKVSARLVSSSTSSSFKTLCPLAVDKFLTSKAWLVLLVTCYGWKNAAGQVVHSVSTKYLNTSLAATSLTLM